MNYFYHFQPFSYYKKCAYLKEVIRRDSDQCDTEWFDEFWEECLILECRIDYIATHLYTGTIDERMKKLKDYSQRYGKQRTCKVVIWAS